MASSPASTKTPPKEVTPASSSKRLDRPTISPRMPKFQNQPIITLVVGKENPQSFVIHQGFAFQSPVLEKAFTGPFIEAQTRTYRLEDNTTAAVELLVQWLYTGAFDILPKSIDLSEGGNRIAKMAEDLVLMELWVLAERFLIPSLQNHVIRKIHDLRNHHHKFSISTLNYIYANTPNAKSPLRQLLVHHCSSLFSVTFSSFPEMFPKEMLLELIVFMFTDKEITEHRLAKASMIDIKKFEVSEV